MTRRAGVVFFGPVELGSRRLARLSDLMRLVPGIQLAHLGGLGYAVASNRPARSPHVGFADSRACYFDILLDGRRTLSPGARA